MNSNVKTFFRFACQTSLTPFVSHFQFLIVSQFHHLYLECLKNDIYYQELIQIPNASLYNLAKEYHFEVNDDLLEEKLKEGRNLSKKILDKMLNQFPENYVEFYFENYVVKKNSSN